MSKLYIFKHLTCIIVYRLGHLQRYGGKENFQKLGRSQK